MGRKHSRWQFHGVVLFTIANSGVQFKGVQTGTTTLSASTQQAALQSL